MLQQPDSSAGNIGVLFFFLVRIFFFRTIFSSIFHYLTLTLHGALSPFFQTLPCHTQLSHCDSKVTTAHNTKIRTHPLLSPSRSHTLSSSPEFSHTHASPHHTIYIHPFSKQQKSQTHIFPPQQSHTRPLLSPHHNHNHTHAFSP